MRSSYSLTALKRWSCKAKELPGTPTIKSIHVYDFDNTLFCSPLPNPQVWTAPTIGMLQAYETFANGGWWHDQSILAATGQGMEKEEPRAWAGHWNEAVVELVQLSVESKDVLTVLLTGRNETNFADLINRICSARKLDFDMVVLKPEVSPSNQTFETTIQFKQEFLKELVFTYKHSDDVKIYEDRPKHVKGFRDFFERLNKSLISHPVDQPPPVRKPITAEVVHVCELKSSLEPETEVEVIQRIVNRHNHTVASGQPNMTRSTNRRLKILDNFVYFGYLIGQFDSARLLTLINTPPHLIDSGEVRLLASSILITPYYPRKDILDKVGGRGNKVTWQVTGIAKFEDRIWAARVAPVSETQIYTQDPTPMVVLAIRKGSRQVDAARIQNWQPVAPEKAFMFETTVGDKVMLKIEEASSTDYQSRGARSGRVQGDAAGDVNGKRKFHDEAEFSGRDNQRRGGERNDGSWGPGKQRHNNHGGRFASKNAFNNRENPNVAGGNNPPRQNQQGNKAQNQQGGHGQRQRGGNAASRNRAGGHAGGGGNRGPPPYKSLDDYGPGNFDGAGDAKGGGVTAEMVMNY